MREERRTIAASTDGLGNRIKCFVSASMKDNDAGIFWPRTRRCDCDFLDLFENQDLLVEVLPPEADLVTSWRLTGFPIEWIPEGFATHTGYRKEDGRTIDFEYNRIPEPIKKHVSPYFSRLRPSRIVREQISNTQDLFDPSTVSVHIRSWVDSSERAYKFSLGNYFRIMDHFPDRSFFLASDSKSVSKKVEKRYPGRIITPTSVHPDVRRGNVHQQALAEMYLLGANEWLISSHGSTFSEVAWWLGGASANVEVAPLKAGTGEIGEISPVRLFLYRVRKRLRL